MTVLIFMCTMPAAVLAADETYDFTVVLQISNYNDANHRIKPAQTETTLTALKEALKMKRTASEPKVYTTAPIPRNYGVQYRRICQLRTRAENMGSPTRDIADLAQYGLSA
jgi:hypothetical protein